MKKVKWIELNNPISYIFATFILGSFIFELLHREKLLAIFLVSSFFIFVFLFRKMLFTVFIAMFFLLSLLNNFLYFTYEPKENEEIRIEKLNHNSVIGDVRGRKIILELNNFNEIREGQKITAQGKFFSNRNIQKGIIGVYKIDNYVVLPSDFLSIVRQRREKVFNLIKVKLGDRKSGLICSVAFGYSKMLNGEDREEMKSVGISHALAISGLHIALIYGILKRFMGVKVSLLCTFLYVIFTGASVSTVRAFIMILILSLSVVVKRNYNSIATLSFAGVVILLWKPYELFSLGFLLSFLATLGIILHNRKVNKALFMLPTYIRKGCSLCISSQIYTFPIIIMVLNEFSLTFLIGNIIILPFLNILVVLGNMVLLLSFSPDIFNFLLYISYYIIKIIDKIMIFMNNFQNNIIYLNSYISYLYISILITYYFYRRGFKNIIHFPIFVGIFILILIYSPIPRIKYYREGALQVSYRGEEILIQTSKNINKNKLIHLTISDKIFKDINNINIGDSIWINKYDDNYILNLNHNTKYLLKVNWGKTSNLYDIIDFMEGTANELWVVNDKVILR